MSKSFTQKLIEIRLTLADGGFAGGENTKIIRGLGCDVEITKPGLPAKNSCKATIWGMPLADMEALTMLAFEPLKVSKNRIAVYAGDEAGLALAFAGDITSAWPDFNSSPDVAFRLEALTGYVASVTPRRIYSAGGDVSIDAIMRRLAGEMGLAYVNNGVSGSLIQPALSGGLYEQAYSVARMADFELLLDDESMVIQPWDAVRDADTDPPVWRDSTGVKGYPTFTQTGISVTGLYAPALVQGGLLQLESIVPKAGGNWKIISLKHRLQAHYPGASQWHTTVEGAYLAGK